MTTIIVLDTAWTVGIGALTTALALGAACVVDGAAGGAGDGVGAHELDRLEQQPPPDNDDAQPDETSQVRRRLRRPPPCAQPTHIAPPLDETRIEAWRERNLQPFSTDMASLVGRIGDWR